MQEKDVNGKTILDDPLLYSQFVRDNITDIPLLRNVQPEDIEDVTAKYQTFMGSEYKADLVKRIKLRRLLEKDAGESAVNSQTETSGDDANEEQVDSIYVVSLVEHKSSVDFDVAMQLLRYMVCIWTQYAKEMDAQLPHVSKRKGFRYPPILPIVYYEGKGTWTADRKLLARVMMSEMFGKYMPDFTYHLVRIHDYSNEELLSRKDAMSVLMMINKIQTSDDLTQFIKDRGEHINQILCDAPQSVLAIMADTVASLCRRLNVPDAETSECVEKVRRRDMGYLFENMEKMDIQEERRKTEEQRRKTEEQRRKTEEARKQADEAQKQAEEAQKQADEAQQKAKEGIVVLCQEFGLTRQETISKVMSMCNLMQAEATKVVERYWK